MQSVRPSGTEKWTKFWIYNKETTDLQKKGQRNTECG